MALPPEGMEIISAFENTVAVAGTAFTPIRRAATSNALGARAASRRGRRPRRSWSFTVMTSLPFVLEPIGPYLVAVGDVAFMHLSPELSVVGLATTRYVPDALTPPAE